MSVNPSPTTMWWAHLKPWHKALGLLLAMGCIVAGGWYRWYNGLQLYSPVTSESVFQFLGGETPRGSNKVVYGFLPYWNIEKTTLQPELTHLSYFGLTIGGDGSLVTQIDGGGEPGYNKLQNSDTLLTLINKVQQDGDRLELTLIQFDNDDIVNLTNSPTAQQNLLNNIDAMLLAYPVSGINIDVEYTGEVTDQLRERFAQLVGKITDHIHTKYENTTVSIDMYASASTRKQIWDVGTIGQHVDYIVIMAYDFHRRSSIVAGPVAPLFGGKKLWDSDISQQLQAFIKQVPPQKLLLGIPFYGYEWQTTSTDPQAHTFPDTGVTASFDRVQSLLARKEELKLTENWNADALSPYLTYQEDGETYVVYYENSRSISYKLDFVNQLDLGGVAIWALGYEGDSRELWDVIDQKIGQTR